MKLQDAQERSAADVGSDDDDANGSTSVTKALRLLDAFRPGGRALGVSELARRAQVPKSTAFRLLGDLQNNGYIERDGKGYRLTWKVQQLGSFAESSRTRELREIANPHLTQLHIRTGCIAHLAILVGAEVVYLDKVSGSRAITVPTRVGGRMPATCTGLGKALLAASDNETVRRVIGGGLGLRTRYSINNPRRFINELLQAKEDGIAVDREEAALGLFCVASVVDVGDGLIAAVSASNATNRYNQAKAIGREVRLAATETSSSWAKFNRRLAMQ